MFLIDTNGIVFDNNGYEGLSFRHNSSIVYDSYSNYYYAGIYVHKPII